MAEKRVWVTQSWDDGVEDDPRLIELLRRHGARGAFNLNAGLHGKARGGEWIHKGKTVRRLALGELREIYDAYEGAEVANHSLKHPWLTRVSPEEARRDISDGRKALEDLFQRPVTGFAYPYADHNAEVRRMVRETGHAYARATVVAGVSWPPADAMEWHPQVSFKSPDFWAEFERAAVEGGVFCLMGHSYEFLDEAMWRDFDAKLARLSADPRVRWATPREVFAAAPAA
jgi:peptidoglycan/xylan/chitin deacetylase (PgdA/CDA1 family)